MADGHYTLLAAGSTGEYLSHDLSTDELVLRPHCDDSTFWISAPGAVCNAATGLTLHASRASAGGVSVAGVDAFGQGAAAALATKRFRLALDEGDGGGEHDVDGRDVVDGDPTRSLQRASARGAQWAQSEPQASAPLGVHLLEGEVYASRDAPSRLPSDHLSDLETVGFTVVDNIMSPAMLQNLHANISATRERHASAEEQQKVEQDARPYASFDNILSPGIA